MVCPQVLVCIALETAAEATGSCVISFLNQVSSGSSPRRAAANAPNDPGTTMLRLVWRSQSLFLQLPPPTESLATRRVCGVGELVKPSRASQSIRLTVCFTTLVSSRSPETQRERERKLLIYRWFSSCIYQLLLVFLFSPLHFIYECPVRPFCVAVFCSCAQSIDL